MWANPPNLQSQGCKLSRIHYFGNQPWPLAKRDRLYSRGNLTQNLMSTQVDTRSQEVKEIWIFTFSSKQFLNVRVQASKNLSIFMLQESKPLRLKQFKEIVGLNHHLSQSPKRKPSPSRVWFAKWCRSMHLQGMGLRKESLNTNETSTFVPGTLKINVTDITVLKISMFSGETTLGIWNFAAQNEALVSLVG